MEKAGYAVGLTGKGWGPGDFKAQARRTRHPAGPSFDERRSSPPASGIGRNDCAKNLEAFLGQREKAKPFCLWMGFNEPHRAYGLNSGVRLGKKLPEVTVPPCLPDTAVVRGDLADYAIEVEWADAFIGQALAGLEARGELENTLVVVTSDHGMPFPCVKGQIHEDGFRLPLAMRWGRGRPNDVGYPVRALQTRDFLHVHNFHPDGWPAGNPATDFGNCDPGPTKELLEAIGGHFHDLSFGKRLPDELCDLRTDPAGVNNLAHDLAPAGTMAAMRGRMMKLLTDEQDPRALGQAAIFDTYQYVGAGGGNKSCANWLKAQEEKPKLSAGEAAPKADAAPRKNSRKKQAETKERWPAS